MLLTVRVLGYQFKGMKQNSITKLCIALYADNTQGAGEDIILHTNALFVMSTFS